MYTYLLNNPTQSHHHQEKGISIKIVINIYYKLPPGKKQLPPSLPPSLPVHLQRENVGRYETGGQVLRALMMESQTQLMMMMLHLVIGVTRESDNDILFDIEYIRKEDK